MLYGQADDCEFNVDVNHIFLSVYAIMSPWFDVKQCFVCLLVLLCGVSRDVVC